MRRRLRLKRSKKTGTTLLTVTTIGTFSIVLSALWFVYPIYLEYKNLQQEQHDLNTKIEKNLSYLDTNFHLPSKLNESELKQIELRLPTKVDASGVINQLEKATNESEVQLVNMQLAESVKDLFKEPTSEQQRQNTTADHNQPQELHPNQSSDPKNSTSQQSPNQTQTETQTLPLRETFPFQIEKDLVSEYNSNLQRHWVLLEVDATEKQVTTILEKIQHLERIIQVDGWNYAWIDDTKKERLSILLSFYSYQRSTTNSNTSKLESQKTK